MSDLGMSRLLLAQANETASAGPSGWVMLAVLLAIFLVPTLLGKLVARLLKLKDLAGRFSVVLFALTLGFAPFIWHLYDGNQQGESWQESLQDAVRLGIDLKGGTYLVFEVDRDASEKEITDQVMEQMVAAIAKRINPGGIEEVVVRRVGFDRIEIIIPGVDPDEVQRTKDKMTRLGSLEFAILANHRNHRDIIDQALAMDGGEKDLREDGRVIASWREVGLSKEGIPKVVGTEGSVVTRDGRTLETTEKPVPEFLVVFEREDSRVTGQFLVNVNPSSDPSGGLAVAFRFNGEGAKRFYILTKKYKPAADGSFHRRLAILLDGNIHSAPRINEPIGASGQISGDFDREEIDELVSVLNAGALEVPIKREPIQEMTIGPTLAADVKTKGVYSILLAGGTVMLFMLAYYWFAGFVAVMCLALNLLLVMGIMSSIGATFTLPGLAGLVLTIGMAVDANVLIFERIREELRRGSSFRMSIHNGFSRAFTTIVDANVTTLIIAVVLYLIGTDQIRGFAVTLFIGIVMSMFTSLYFGRLVFDVVERKRWLTNLKMLSIVGTTHWDFISKRTIAGVVSAVFIVAGMGALFARGERNLDIDFTGGTMATMQFVNTVDRAEVRKALNETFDEAVSLEELKVEGAVPDTRFRMRTTKRDADTFDEFAETEEGRETVQSLINQAFQDKPGFELKKITIENETFLLQPIPVASDESDKDSQSQVAEKFARGHSVELQFSDEMPAMTAASYLERELGTFRDAEGFGRYENAGSLIEFTSVGTGKTKLLLRATPEIATADLTQALEQMRATMAESPLLEEVNSFAGSVAAEMQQSAMLAMLASLVAIVAYIWFRFQRITFGLAAVAALVHDVLVVLGLVAMASFVYGQGFTALGLEDFKINLPMIAAFLTIVGYSLNDTIVVFDRVREVRGKNPALTVEMVNTSLNQTLARTLLTSITTLLVVSILYAFGGEGIHGFAFCLVMGVIVGTYSSIYVASPVLLWLMNRTGDTARQAASAAG